MNKLIITSFLAFAALTAAAMPTKKELAKAQKLVEDVTESDLAAVKAGTKSAKEAADRHKELADKSAQEAEKYLLLQGAFKLYARCEEYDLAADMLNAINREVENVPPEVTMELISEEFRRGMEKKAPKVLAIFKQAKRTSKYKKDLVSVEVALKSKPKDENLHRKHGECLAELGNWKGAADAFAKAGGDLAKMIAAEKDGKISRQQIADFWWDYSSEGGITPYKVHAAELYQKAMSDTKFDGLARTRAEQRIKESLPVLNGSPLRGLVDRKDSSKDMKIFDIGNGVKLSMAYCPEGVFRKGFEKYSVGDVSMVPSSLIPHDVKISRHFWMARYPITYAQVKELIPSLVDGKEWQELVKAHGPHVVFSGADGLDAAAVCRKMNERFGAEIPSGYVFRLPTEAEWEYCLKEGGTCADQRLNREGVYSDRAATSWTEDRKAAHPDLDPNRGCGVGLKKPNAWGLYDMIGTISQIFLDNGSFQMGVQADGITIDPFQNDRSAKLHALYPQPGGNASRLVEIGRMDWAGFRICLGPDLVSEQKKVDVAKAAPAVSKGSNLTFDLEVAPGMKYEFVKIAPREFKMTTGHKEPLMDVKITRPYYIARMPITAALWQSVMGKPYNDTYEKRVKDTKESDWVIDNVSPFAAGILAKKFTEIFKKNIPEGYVVRLPSRAEWELAVQGDGSNPSMVMLARGTPDGQWRGDNIHRCKNEAMTKAKIKFGDKIGGVGGSWASWSKPAETFMTDNGIFGVGYLSVNVLDRYDYSDKAQMARSDEKMYPKYDVNIDPLVWTENEGANVGAVRVNNAYNRPSENTSVIQNASAYTYFCIGPDLVSEQKAKQKNDGAKDMGADLAKEKREMEEKIAAQREDKLYCVIDLSGGPNAKSYPVTYLDRAPVTGWSDEYKTAKMVLRKIKPGSFECLPGKKFTLTKPYYMGVFEVTQKQYELVMGNNPAARKGDRRPVEQVSYEMIRGRDKGLQWPASNEVDDGSFIMRLRACTKLPFDLPTEVQWEYSCRATTTTKYNNGGNADQAMIRLGKCMENGGGAERHVVVGMFVPNRWGLYDMHGNVWEWCLDRESGDESGCYTWSEKAKESMTDPKGYALGDRRICRGGSAGDSASMCNSEVRLVRHPDVHRDPFGFRLAIQTK